MTLNEKFAEALGFAFELHREQQRKTTHTPYISHLMSVSALVLEYGGTEDEAIAALLHDTLEDQSGNYNGGREALEKTIRNRFGDNVLSIVLGCTEAAYPKPKPSWRKRKRDYIHQVKQANNSVQCVATADKIHNLRTMTENYYQMGDALWTVFTAGRDQTLWFYRAMSDAMKDANPSHPLTAELARTVAIFENTTQG